MQPDPLNEIFELAVQLVNNTSQHIFLTGKAGTGKTTFLRHIKSITRKKTVIVAPTGVAAINAGGVTMHSFFQLPFGPYIPQSYNANKFGDHKEIADKNTLFRNIRFDKNKRTIINELELLIIDEISMVRADMLDAIDIILRYYRKAMHLPFGGVQVLYIGDMYQLPPVIKDQEWQLLQDYYNSHFFFDALACQEAPPLYIELKKIYRQQDQLFIDILNRVRNNIPTNDDLEILNDQYNSNIDHNQKDTILLTTHNAKADDINQQELYKLNALSHKFRGTVEGDFNDKLLPNDLELELKEGAKIMFIRNDTSPEKKYFNGKLATIIKIYDGKIIVECTGDKQVFTLKQEVWKNIRYKITEASQIEEEELGSYTQYPIRLAWAVTIHKSQGLTFEKVMIDAGRSFAAGQVYVALSRCTSLQGITLHSKIERSAISTDERIIKFAKQEAKNDELQRVLAIEKEQYMANQLVKQFSFQKLVSVLEQYKQIVHTKKIPDQEATELMSTSVLLKAEELQTVSAKFQAELTNILNGNKASLTERITKAQLYFNDQLINHILKPLQQHYEALKKASKVKQYLEALKTTLTQTYTIIHSINDVEYDGLVFNSFLAKIAAYDPAVKKETSKTKEEKIPSADITLEMYKEGKDAAQIAVIRALAPSTIEGHLAQHVRSGAISVLAIVSKENLTIITKAIEKVGGRATTAIKEVLPDYITHGEVRAVLNHLDWQVEQEEKNKEKKKDSK